MKRFAFVAAAVLLLTLSLSAAGLASGKVGVIDLAVIMDESKAGKQANAVLATFIEERQQAVLPMEAQLEQLAEAIENGGESMSDDERGAKQAEFDALAQEYLVAVDQFEAEIEDALLSLREQILADIGVVLQMVGDSRGFDLIMDASTAYYYRRTIDLTFEVIREYDDLWEVAQRQAP